MGGWGSGQQGGRPLAETSLRIDIAWMIRTGHAVPGSILKSSLHWSANGEPTASIGYTANMVDPENAWLELRYSRGSGGTRETVEQNVRIVSTIPNYGGKRWWMICPYRHGRAGKLYLPAGGDRFASRAAWRIGYRSQRQASHDRPFEALFRLQRKLGCEAGWEQPIYRPKGMWRRTFERHETRYYDLDDRCALEALRLMARL